MTNLSDEGSSPPSKSSLQKWWKRFNKKPDKPAGTSTVAHSNAGGVFGVSLQDSLRYASVAISQVGPDGKARIYGHIPVVVAKTGLYLKENGTTTQGVFRVSGSNKRIKELEQTFDSYPSYGKNLTWDSFSVHDAASVFRRYLNMLPEPIIPFVLYQSFQDALPRHPTEGPLTEPEQENAVAQFKGLINSLPPASQHIFFYVLDLLGVFARRSESNLMPASNLATIFQPGLLRYQPTTSAPSEDDRDAVRLHIEADAAEHKKSQEVLEFLIQNQSSFELELPPHVVAGKKMTKRKSATPKGSIPSRTSLESPSTSPALSSRQLSPAMTVPSHQNKLSTSLESEEENDWATARREVADLNRRGSDKSEDRRRLRRKKAEQKREQSAQSGQVGVKRSRTLPTGREGRRKAEDPVKHTEPLQPRATAATTASRSPPLSIPSTSAARPSTAPLAASKSSTLNTSSRQATPNLEVRTKIEPPKSPKSPAIESASDMSISPTGQDGEKKRWWKSNKRASVDLKGLSASRSHD